MTKFGPILVGVGDAFTVTKGSQHPADLKPRGVKAPMHLLPWDVIPGDFIPEDLWEALHDRLALPTASLPYRLLETLLKRVPLADVAAVFEHGAKKYARDNWKTFEWDRDAEDAYFGAICRHLVAEQGGQSIDPESGISHAAHACAGCLIWLWHISQKE